MGDNIADHPYIKSLTKAIQELKQGMAQLLQDWQKPSSYCTIVFNNPMRRGKAHPS